MNTQPISNASFSSQYRLDAQPNLSSQLGYDTSYNAVLTKERDLARYYTSLSSKNNIYDQSRIVSPLNYFGVRFIEGDDTRQRFSPAGMNMENSRKISGVGFTKPVVRHYPQNL
jgi:hypothetical protein